MLRTGSKDEYAKAVDWHQQQIKKPKSKKTD